MILPQKQNHQIIGGGSEGMTAYGGLALLHEVMEGIGFVSAAHRLLPRPGSGRGYGSAQMMKRFMSLLHIGGETLSDIRTLNNDGFYHRSPPISAEAMRRHLHRLKGGDGMEGLLALQRHVLARAMSHEAKLVGLIMDVDDTVIAADKHEAKWAYNRERGFMATAATIAGLDYLLHERLRTGNRPPGSDQVEFLNACMEQLPAGCRVSVVRADSASYRSEVLNWCHAAGCRFLIAARRDAAVCELADSVPDGGWREMRETDGSVFHLAEKTHILGKGVAPFRLLLIRRPKRQKALLAGAELCGAIATDLDGDIADILRLYRDRGECENRIKEFKSGFAAGRPPCSDLAANAVWTRINAIAYNLFILMRRLLWTRRWQIKTVRWRFYHIAGRLIRSGRRLAIRVNEQHYQTLALCQRRLRLRI